MGINKKISEFTVQTSVADAALFTLVDGGQNIAISVSDFLTSRTLQGTLQTSGPTVSTPVLQIVGQQNIIRNLVAGSNITLSIEGENGLQIDAAISSSVTQVTGNYAQIATDDIIVITGPATLTLLQASATTKQLTIKSKKGGGDVTVTPFTGDTVDAETTVVLSADSAMTIVPITLDWETL